MIVIMQCASRKQPDADRPDEQNTSGSQAFYVRELDTGITTLVSKNSNILLQFWPTCLPPAP